MCLRARTRERERVVARRARPPAPPRGAAPSAAGRRWTTSDSAPPAPPAPRTADTAPPPPPLPPRWRTATTTLGTNSINARSKFFVCNSLQSIGEAYVQQWTTGWYDDDEQHACLNGSLETCRWFRREIKLQDFFWMMFTWWAAAESRAESKGANAVEGGGCGASGGSCGAGGGRGAADRRGTDTYGATRHGSSGVPPPLTSRPNTEIRRLWSSEPLFIYNTSIYVYILGLQTKLA